MPSGFAVHWCTWTQCRQMLEQFRPRPKICHFILMLLHPQDLRFSAQILVLPKLCIWSLLIGYTLLTVIPRKEVSQTINQLQWLWCVWLWQHLWLSQSDAYWYHALEDTHNSHSFLSWNRPVFVSSFFWSRTWWV